MYIQRIAGDSGPFHISRMRFKKKVSCMSFTGRSRQLQHFLAVIDSWASFTFSSLPLLSERPALVPLLKISQGGLLPNRPQLRFERGTRDHESRS